MLLQAITVGYKRIGPGCWRWKSLRTELGQVNGNNGKQEDNTWGVEIPRSVALENK